MYFSEALELGKIKEFGQPDKVIDTVLSKVFFFGDRVIKVYKHEGAFRINLADPVFRREFYAEDFFWNHEAAPEIYLKLGGVKEDNGNFIFVDLEEADDFFIEMAKIDDNNNLTKLLQNKAVSLEHIEGVTHSFIKKLRLLTKNRREKLKHLFSASWLSLHSDYLEDLRSWIHLAEDYMSKEEIDSIIDFLQETARQEDYFIHFDSADLSIAIDNNPDNILISENQPSFFDIMPVREGWKVSDEFFSVAGIALSTRVLGDQILSNQIYKIYEQYRAPVSEKIRLIYEIRGALINFWYRHMIGQHELAERFKTVFMDDIKTLKNL
jgi:aminoglycoside phosphotransferase family enzyme